MGSRFGWFLQPSFPPHSLPLAFFVPAALPRKTWLPTYEPYIQLDLFQPKQFQLLILFLKVMFNVDKPFKLIDFGLSEQEKEGRQKRKLQKTKGTPGYMAPEMIFNEGLPDKAFLVNADIFSYGMVLYVGFNNCTMCCVLRL